MTDHTPPAAKQPLQQSCSPTRLFHRRADTLVQTGGSGGEGFEVQKYGDGRVALIGFPSGAWWAANLRRRCYAAGVLPAFLSNIRSDPAVHPLPLLAPPPGSGKVHAAD